MKKTSMLLVLSGPSGVGKDTVINMITSKSNFQRVPSCTTRKPRLGEINGIHYNFIDEKTFIMLYDQGKLLDNVIITDNHYGVPLEEVGKILDSGNNIALHLVVGSALMLKRIIPNAFLVFLMPPSNEKIIERLRKRGMKEDDIIKRLHDDPTNLQDSRFYDLIVVNHDGQEQLTADKILQCIIAQKTFDNLPNVSEYNRILCMYPELFATTNINKLNEVNKILGQEFKQVTLNLYEPQGIDVKEVVRLKAKDAFHQTGKLVLVEDTSLEFLAWNKLPGALIKWFLDTVGNEGMLKMLIGTRDRRAVAKTAVGFFDGNDSHMFVGEVTGTISEEIRGDNGFGWDKIFIPDGYDKSYAEMKNDEKNQISMRYLALKQMQESLK